MTETKNGYPNATDAQGPTGDRNRGPAMCDVRTMTSRLTPTPTLATSTPNFAMTTVHSAMQSMAEHH